ncbi:hypothetical protein LCGC14_1818140 [marine sediment metagenome]|uniref:Uncharacterized protein n=1 Tax=marine sediment metagenome TaxID=412755 RepID=A0A0F9H7U7_9ZZZZ
MTDPIPKSLQDGPKAPEPEKIDGWLRAVLKRQPWWPRPEFKPRHEEPWTLWSYKLIAAHIDMATPGGLRDW